MSNRFNDAMQRANTVMETIMGEPFTVAGGIYPAIDIGAISEAAKQAPGGLHKPGTLLIHVRKEIYELCGLKPLAPLQARGVNLRLDSILHEGDGTIVMTCGPATVAAKV